MRTNAETGVTKLYPLVEFDLQSGEAGLFQRVFRRVRGRFKDDVDPEVPFRVPTKATRVPLHGHPWSFDCGCRV